MGELMVLNGSIWVYCWFKKLHIEVNQLWCFDLLYFDYRGATEANGTKGATAGGPGGRQGVQTNGRELEDF